MSTTILTTASVTDASHLVLRQPLLEVPVADVRVMIFLDPPRTDPGATAAADFLAWARRPRPAVGLRDAGRDVIYED